MKKKLGTKKKTATPKLAPCACEFNKKITSMFDESFGRLREMGPEPVEEYNCSLMHSNNFHTMMNCLWDGEGDAGYIMSDMFRLGVEAGKRMQEVNFLEKLVGY